MGMVCSFIRVSDEKLDALKTDPYRILLYAPSEGTEDFHLNEYRELVRKSLQPKVSLFKRLFAAKHIPKDEPEIQIPEIVWQEGENAEGYIDKAWDLLHAGLTGTGDGGSWPLSFLKGYDIADYFSQDMNITFGYRNRQVKEIAKALQTITGKTILEQLGRLEEGTRNEIYLSEFLLSEDKEDREYITENFEDLKRFIEETADLGFAILFDIG
jgi:hypothetical protein